MSVSSVELHRLKREIEFLESKKGRGTELITLYIPPNKNLADVMAQMREEYSQAMNIKSARTRKNVQSAIEVIMQRLKLFKRPPEKGMVLLAGVVPRGTKDKMEVYIIEPPEPLTTYLYRCDSRFLLEPIKEMLSERGSYGLLLVDRNEATVGMLRGKRIETLRRIISNVPRKHGRGGQSQRRFERLIEIAAHEYFKRVGEKASEVFLNEPELKGVIVGGPGPTKEFFVNADYLHHEVKKKIIGIVDTSYTDEFGLTELVDKAGELLEEMEIVREKKLVQRFLQEVVRDGGLAAYGIEEVRKYLRMGAVEVLLFSEDVESYRVKIVCGNCGHEEERTTSSLRELEQKLATEKCGKCGEQALSVESFRSTLDELKELADQTSAQVEVISTETEEGQQLRSFGGVAAILRYRPEG